MKKLTVNRKRKQLEIGTFYKHVGRKAKFSMQQHQFCETEDMTIFSWGQEARGDEKRCRCSEDSILGKIGENGLASLGCQMRMASWGLSLPLSQSQYPTLNLDPGTAVSTPFVNPIRQWPIPSSVSSKLLSQCLECPVALMRLKSV